MAYREKRQTLNWSRKTDILNETGFKCARCGCKIGVSEGTVDHYLPLARGGRNESRNYIALCDTCNKEKQDFVYDPEEWYKFVPEKKLNELKKIYEAYKKSNTWFTRRHFTPDDAFVFAVDSYAQGIIFSHLGRGNTVNTGTMRYRADRADYSRLQEVYDYAKKIRGDKYDKDGSIKEYISSVFMDGAFYIVTGKSKEIIAILSVHVRRDSESEFASIVIESIRRVTKDAQKELNMAAVIQGLTTKIMRGILENIPCVTLILLTRGDSLMLAYDEGEVIEVDSPRNTVRYVLAQRKFYKWLKEHKLLGGEKYV